MCPAGCEKLLGLLSGCVSPSIRDQGLDRGTQRVVSVDVSMDVDRQVRNPDVPRKLEQIRHPNGASGEEREKKRLAMDRRRLSVGRRGYSSVVFRRQLRGGGGPKDGSRNGDVKFSRARFRGHLTETYTNIPGRSARGVPRTELRDSKKNVTGVERVCVCERFQG